MYDLRDLLEYLTAGAQPREVAPVKSYDERLAEKLALLEKIKKEEATRLK